jgi:hypothetical protein
MRKEPKMKSKKIAAAAMGAALLGGAGLTSLMTTTAGAADSTTSTTAASSATTKEKPDQWMTDALAKLVTAGTLTQAQSDAVTKALDAARPAGGPGQGRGGGPGLTVAAKALGVSAADLRTALQSGKTIADVAKTKSVDLQTVIAAIVASENEHLAQAVTDGKLTQAQADTRTANATERATNMVNGVRPERPADASSSATSS